MSGSFIWLRNANNRKSVISIDQNNVNPSWGEFPRFMRWIIKCKFSRLCMMFASNIHLFVLLRSLLSDWVGRLLEKLFLLVLSCMVLPEDFLPNLFLPCLVLYGSSWFYVFMPLLVRCFLETFYVELFSYPGYSSQCLRLTLLF